LVAGVVNWIKVSCGFYDMVCCSVLRCVVACCSMLQVQCVGC